MAVVRRGKNSWSVVLRLPDPKTGQKKQKWFGGFRTRKDAERYEVELLHQLNMGGFVQPSTETLGAYLKRWLDTEARRTVSPTTYRRYEQIIRVHIIPALGHIRMDRLRPADLAAFYQKLLEDGRRDGKTGGLHPRSVLHCHRVLHRALEVAVKWGLVGRNVCDAVEPPRPGTPKRTVLSAEEAIQLLDAARNTRLYPLIATALATGMRLGELLGLKWEDVNLEEGVCYVRRTLKKAGREPVFGPVKTHRSERPVTLGAETVAILRKWRAEQAREKLAFRDRYRDYGLVFTLPDGGAIDPCNLTQKRFKELLRKANLPEHHVFHSLRHTAATLALRAGVPAKTVSDRLGHSTVGLTLDVYTHYVPELQKEAANLTDSLLFGSGKRALTI